MTFQLVVMKPFQGFKRGDVIADAAAINKILAGGQAGFVVRVSAKEA
jgi:hypothetical protein